MTSQPENAASTSTRAPDPENGQDALVRDLPGQEHDLPGQDEPGQGRFGQDLPGQDEPGQGSFEPDLPGQDLPGQDPAAPAADRHVVERIAPLQETSSPGDAPAMAGASGPALADRDAAGSDGTARAAAEDEATRPRIAEPGAPAAAPDSSDLVGEGASAPAAALAARQWPGILALFVDDPRGAVERAAAAAREQAAALAASLEREQAALGASWQEDASTEDLRTALQQYRSFCGRLEAWA